MDKDQKAIVHPWKLEFLRTKLKPRSWNCAVSRYMPSIGNSNFDLKEDGIMKVTVGYRVAATEYSTEFESINANAFFYLALDSAVSMGAAIVGGLASILIFI